MVVGLGNPGPKYAETRHNMGFLVLDELLRSFPSGWQEKFQGEYARVQLDGQTHTLLKPMTFMNLSGKSAARAAQFFKHTVQSMGLVGFGQ